MKRKKSWRDVIPPHPAADLFPVLPEDQLRELAKDIEAHGLTSPIVTWSPGNQEQRDAPAYVLDGRNRLDAMERVLGWTLVRNGKLTIPSSGPAYALALLSRVRHLTELLTTMTGADLDGRESHPSTDPYVYVLSANVHRRHLTAEQRRDVIRALLEVRSGLSNQMIGDAVGASKDTVRRVREDLATCASARVASVKRVGKDQKRRPAQRSTPEQIEARRATVEELKGEGLPNTQIAKRLDVTETTIRGDLKAIGFSDAKQPPIRAENVSAPKDLEAKRHDREIAEISREDLSDPDWFASQLIAHAGRIQGNTAQKAQR